MNDNIEDVLRLAAQIDGSGYGADSERMATHLYVVAGMAILRLKGQGRPKFGKMSPGDAAWYRDIGVKFANERGVRIGHAAGMVS